jgi:hypothetical protein
MDRSTRGTAGFAALTVIGKALLSLSCPASRLDVISI